jgi:hypothetical protein
MRVFEQVASGLLTIDHEALLPDLHIKPVRRIFSLSANSVALSELGSWDHRSRRAVTLIPAPVEGGAAAIAFDVHLEDGGVVDKAIDDGKRHRLVGEDLTPFAEWLVGGDEQGSPLVPTTDQFEAPGPREPRARSDRDVPPRSFAELSRQKIASTVSLR